METNRRTLLKGLFGGLFAAPVLVKQVIASSQPVAAEQIAAVEPVVAEPVIKKPVKKPIKRGSHIAIARPHGRPDANRKIDLYCLVTKVRGDKIYFHVINGEWSGNIQNDTVYVDATKDKIPGKIIWSGRVPRKLRYDYNKAMQAIEKRL